MLMPVHTLRYLEVEQGSGESAGRGDGDLHVDVVEEVVVLGGLQEGKAVRRRTQGQRGA